MFFEKYQVNKNFEIIDKVIVKAFTENIVFISINFYDFFLFLKNIF